MTDNDAGTLRRVSWWDLCPWLIIFRTFRLASSIRVLLLGAVGAVLMLTLWSLCARMFGVYPLSDDEAVPAAQRAAMQEAGTWMAPQKGCPWFAINAAVPSHPWDVAVPSGLPTGVDVTTPAPTSQYENPVRGGWLTLSQPMISAFKRDTNLRLLACLILCGLTSLAVWAFFGGAIARIAAVQLARDERLGLVPSLRFACRKWLAFFTAPLIPVAGAMVAAIPIWIVGGIMRLDIGLLIMSVIWPVLLVFGLIMILLLLGVLFGWPLMWGTIGVEGTDTFDAMSRSYAYTFQRPLRYLIYAVIAGIYGWLCWLLVRAIAGGVIWMTQWAASWGMDPDHYQQLVKGVGETGMAHAGIWLIWFWFGCVKHIAFGFFFGFLFVSAVSIYYLLRRDVDVTEMDEVFLDADESELAAPLPPIGTDAAGAPVAPGASASMPPTAPAVAAGTASTPAPAVVPSEVPPTPAGPPPVPPAAKSDNLAPPPA